MLTLHIGLASSGSQHNKLRKDVDEHNPAYERDSKLSPGHQSLDSGVGINQTSPTKPAYWGDIPGEGHNTAARGPSDHSRLGDSATESAGRHHGGITSHDDSRYAEQDVGGGLSRGAHGTHGGAARDLPDRSRFTEDTTDSTGHQLGSNTSRHSPRHGEQAVGGGIYNSVTGTGSPEHGTHHSGHHSDVVHDPLTSGTKGIPVSSGLGGNTYDQKTDLRGDGAPSSRNNHTGLGLSGAGAAAGVGAAAAGYGAHEHGRHGQDDRGLSEVQRSSGYGGNQSGGVPRTSMLDPEPRSTATGSQAGPTGSAGPQPGFTDPTPTAAGHVSGGSPSHSNTGAGFGSTASSASGSAGGLGRSHYGPGHEGSKVLHTCQHCGRDNDISQYFSKDVVYRLGS